MSLPHCDTSISGPRFHMFQSGFCAISDSFSLRNSNIWVTVLPLSYHLFRAWWFSSFQVFDQEETAPLESPTESHTHPAPVPSHPQPRYKDYPHSMPCLPPHPVNQYSIVLNDDLNPHDPRALTKCCETLAFVVRDVAHVTPHNFESCVHAIRVFVEASLNGGKENFCLSSSRLLCFHTFTTTW